MLSLLPIIDSYEIERFFFFGNINKKAVPKVLSLVSIILHRNKEKATRNLHIEDLWKKKDLFLDYVQQNPKQVWKDLAEYIFIETSEQGKYDLRNEWFYHGFHESELPLERFVVLLVTKALVALSNSCKKDFQTILQENRKVASLVKNEVMLYALQDVELEWAESIILWLLTDFEHKVVEYPGLNKRELEAARDIIARFSPHIPDHLFRRLEQELFSFYPYEEIEHTKRNIKLYARTIEAYSPYGRTQAYLLPALPSNRTSSRTVDRVKFFKRRYNPDSLGNRKSDRSFAMASAITSPISNKAALKFSDKVWKKKISNPKLVKANFPSNAENYTISKNFGYAFSINPPRYFELISSFSAETSHYYISEVFQVFALKEPPEDAIDDWSPVPVNYIESFSRKALNWDSDHYESTVMQSASVIEKRPSENWSPDFIAFIFNKLEQSNGDERILSRGYRTASLNLPLGKTGHVISRLLWEREVLSFDVEQYMQQLLDARENYVAWALLGALGALYNSNRELWEQYFIQYLTEYPLMSIESGFVHMYYLGTTWKEKKEYILDALKKVEFLYEDDSDASEKNHGFVVANLYIVFKEKQLWDYLVEENHTANFWQGSVQLIAAVFNKKEKYTIENIDCARSLLLHIINREEIPSGSLENLLRSGLDVQKDEKIIFEIINMLGVRSIYVIQSIISESDYKITLFSDVIFHQTDILLEGLEKGVSSEFYNVSIAIDLIVSLYDDTYGRDHIVSNKCLDYWDKLYKQNIGNMRDISKKIIDM